MQITKQLKPIHNCYIAFLVCLLTENIKEFYFFIQSLSPYNWSFVHSSIGSTESLHTNVPVTLYCTPGYYTTLYVCRFSLRVSHLTRGRVANDGK